MGNELKTVAEKSRRNKEHRRRRARLCDSMQVVEEKRRVRVQNKARARTSREGGQISGEGILVGIMKNFLLNTESASF